MSNKVSSEIRFLETINFFGDDVLIPIDRIAFINLKGKEDGCFISIKAKGDKAAPDYFNLEEHFGFSDVETKKAETRWQQIKDILGAK